MDKERILQARKTNLAGFLLAKGEPLIKAGSRYRHKVHDSLVFTENAFYWNSKSLHGNSIDFLMLFYGMDFITAVNELTAYSDTRIVHTPSITFNFLNICVSHSTDKAVSYLCNTRHIDKDIIYDLIRRGLIYQQEKTNNILFPIVDETHCKVGAELHGILPDKRFKGVAQNSKYGYGYNIVYGIPDHMMFFESAVDLISYINILQLENRTQSGVILISMAGLKENVIVNMSEVFRITTPPILCVDNDKAGENFICKMKILLPAVEILLPKYGKDWNEYLYILKHAG